jgi:hypothetical protein
MHAAAPKISAELQAKVVALVMFGDPSLKQRSKFPAALEAKTLENCAVGDPVSCIHIRRGFFFFNSGNVTRALRLL